MYGQRHTLLGESRAEPRRRAQGSLTRNALIAVLGLLVALAGWVPLAQSAEIEVRWEMVDETGADFAVSERQARASIYRGDHLLALRCHSDRGRSWMTLVFSATWFVRPKEHPRFSLTIDNRKGRELFFERETDYRFVATNPPSELLEQLAEGSEAKIAGPDYEGNPVALPLTGSRDAIEGALSLCGIGPQSAAD